MIVLEICLGYSSLQTNGSPCRFREWICVFGLSARKRLVQTKKQKHRTEVKGKKKTDRQSVNEVISMMISRVLLLKLKKSPTTKCSCFMDLVYDMIMYCFLGPLLFYFKSLPKLPQEREGENCEVDEERFVWYFPLRHVSSLSMPWYTISPFRSGNDEVFQSVDPNRETIYDALGNELPEKPYQEELQKYNEWRWRRGIIQSVLPVACTGTIIGFALGYRNSRTEGRYVGRTKVLMRYTATGGTVGLTCAAVHHLLIVRNNYEERFYYPMFAGASGSTIVTLLTQSGTITVGFMAGAMIGSVYSAACWLSKWYERRRLGMFLETQRTMQVPVYKVSPELQPMYRAYLFDNRPLEESTDARRKAALLSRTGDDMRLDAEAFLNNMTPEVYDWVNFPDWWPLKYPLQSEEQNLLVARQRDEEVMRRKNKVLYMDDGAFLRRRLRAAEYRE
jgi:hypothetical protein